MTSHAPGEMHERRARCANIRDTSAISRLYDDKHERRRASGDDLAMSILERSPALRTMILTGAIAACTFALLILPDLEPDHSTLTAHGINDWIGHLITALILAIGVRALRLPIPAWSILAGGIVIDLGHVPQMLGYIGALEGSSRNGSHSLAVVALLALFGFLDRRRANAWLGVAIGAASHLWRDMGTGTVALIWPLTDTVYGTSYHRYLAVLAGLAIAMVGSSGLLDIHAQEKDKRDRSSSTSTLWSRITPDRSPTLPVVGHNPTRSHHPR